MAKSDDVEYKVIIYNPSNGSTEEVPAKNLQYTYSLNDAGSVSFALPLYHPKTTRALLTPGQSNVYVRRNEDLVWGGRLWTAGNDAETSQMQFGGNGWFSILMKRLLDVTKNYRGVEQFDIASDLIAATQAKTNGNLGITIYPTTASGQLRDRIWHGYERKNIGEALQELAAVENGFDFELTPDLKWKTYYPNKGQAVDAPFELGKNMRGYSAQYDATNIENEITGIGSGDGSMTKLSVKSSNASQLDNGLLQGVRSWKDITRQATLDSHTAEELRLSKNLLVRPEFSIITNDPPFGAYSVGDVVSVRINDGYNQIDDAFRITTITVAVGDSGFEAIGLFFDDQVGN